MRIKIVFRSTGRISTRLARTVKFLSVPVIFIAIAVTSNNIFINSLRIVFTVVRFLYIVATFDITHKLRRGNGRHRWRSAENVPPSPFHSPSLYPGLYKLVPCLVRFPRRDTGTISRGQTRPIDYHGASRACGFSCHRGLPVFTQPAEREILSPRREGEEKKSRSCLPPPTISIDRICNSFHLSYVGGGLGYIIALKISFRECAYRTLSEKRNNARDKKQFLGR